MKTHRAYKKISPTIANTAYIDESAVLIGDIVIDQDSSVWPLVAARGDVNYIKVGQRTNIQDGSILHVTRQTSSNPDGYPLIIGDDVTIGHKAMLHGCYIGNRVLIGMGAIVLDGAIIEDDVMLAAGSLVSPNKKLESGYLYMGSPAKQARKLTQAEIDFLKQSALNYVELKDDYL
ncbi:gamma carbonic anhydrase family protein [Catenovulum sp. 2E275]|uniref:gamma carbonic anhydrase family protein n=1 Tax=Catenovulum sp. 2E275 TaxID=2980497 RepID=UPI0021D119C4|nr:gamma carbonic anhydrase family protein [Catenovulum sp. 2E275]MCU4675886.1 gamma carbonic anhydrase family protein [Catenovulum sp. 2E275]